MMMLAGRHHRLEFWMLTASLLSLGAGVAALAGVGLPRLPVVGFLDRVAHGA